MPVLGNSGFPDGHRGGIKHCQACQCLEAIGKAASKKVTSRMCQTLFIGKKVDNKEYHLLGLPGFRLGSKLFRTFSLHTLVTYACLRCSPPALALYSVNRRLLMLHAIDGSCSILRFLEFCCSDCSTIPPPILSTHMHSPGPLEPDYLHTLSLLVHRVCVVFCSRTSMHLSL